MIGVGFDHPESEPANEDRPGGTAPLLTSAPGDRAPNLGEQEPPAGFASDVPAAAGFPEPQGRPAAAGLVGKGDLGTREREEKEVLGQPGGETAPAGRGAAEVPGGSQSTVQQNCHGAEDEARAMPAFGGTAEEEYDDVFEEDDNAEASALDEW